MRGSHFTSRLIVGGFLILLGLGFLLDQFSPFSFGWFIGTWWPMIIVLFGALMLLRQPHHIVFGVVVVLVGVMLQVSELGILPFNVWSLWPLFIVAIGVSVLIRPQRYWEEKYVRNTVSEGENSINESISFASMTKKFKTGKFEGGHVSSSFGEFKLDLRDSKISDGAKLDAECVFGSLEIWLPTGTKIVNRVDAFAGTFDDHTAGAAEGSPTLYITGDVVFGNIKVM